MSRYTEHPILLIFALSLIWHFCSLVSTNPKERERISNLELKEHFEDWTVKFLELLFTDIWTQYLFLFFED